MNTDGNLDAIERELAALVYCLDCNEVISIEDWPDHEYQGTCPNCEKELEKL
jgi:Zn finger protein HypA/HybF involved in hydrogenase expression